MAALLGGILIGLASGLVFLLLGRVSGITGIVADAWPAPRRDWAWRAAFVLGLVAAGTVGSFAAPTAIAGPATSWPIAIGGGLLVGFGARYGGGCTSGHGVCGLSRLSPRSLVATAAFMLAGIGTVFVARHLV